MKIKFILLVCALALTLNTVLAANVAYVDVQKVVTSSAQVQALKKEQQLKAKDLMSFVEKARKEVAAVKDPAKKKALEDKYNKELNTRKAKIDKDYAAKLNSVETSITNVIGQQAKLKGYDIVISKGIVLYGGVDITDDIIKLVK